MACQPTQCDGTVRRKDDRQCRSDRQGCNTPYYEYKEDHIRKRIARPRRENKIFTKETDLKEMDNSRPELLFR